MPQSTPPVRLVADEPHITVGIAAAAWAICWMAGNVFGSLVLTVLGPSDRADTPAVWVTALAATALWIPILVCLKQVSVRFGSGDVRRDLGLSFRPVDLIGIPVGVLTQLVLVRLVYWPLQSIWPNTFSSPQLEESARDLYESAQGALVAHIERAIADPKQYVHRQLVAHQVQVQVGRPVHASTGGETAGVVGRDQVVQHLRAGVGRRAFFQREEAAHVDDGVNVFNHHRAFFDTGTAGGTGP